MFLFYQYSTGIGEEDENEESSDEDEADPTPDSDKAPTPLPSVESFTSSRTPKKHSNSDSGRISMAKASTPKDRHHLVPPSDHSSQSLPEGEFVGVGRHRDGKDIGKFIPFNVC